MSGPFFDVMRALVPTKRVLLVKRLGRVLRGARERQGAVTIAHVAERLDCSTNYWGMVELGERIPSVALLKKATPILGMSADELRRLRTIRAAAKCDDDVIQAQLVAGLGPTAGRGRRR